MLFYFAFTLFVSAGLLFLVQPMVGKMILPRLGGTPAVWNTCMVFFQGVLLFGYAYTHTVSTWQRSRQFLAQLSILLLPFVFFVLPFTLGQWRPPEESNPIFSVLWLLLGMVGLPFFVVATSAPLLQKWFAGTGHPASKDPYFLYGASNLGSMLALLAYPLIVEPSFDVGDFEHIGEQAWLWTAGYALLVLLIVGCMWVVARVPVPALAAAVPQEIPMPAPVDASRAIRRTRHRAAWTLPAEPAPQAVALTRPVAWARRLRWIGLAAAPSSLMLGVTTHLTTDIAAIPFFWVVPLALYLLTFILVFARWPVVWTRWPHTVILYLQPLLMLALVLIFVAQLELDLPFRTWIEFSLHGLVFFLTTLMCHGELAKDRPATSHLTDFYLCLSLGGVLGGMFNALVAPTFFKFGVIEYPLALVLACLLRPSMVGSVGLIPGDSETDHPTLLGRTLDLAMPVLIGLWTYVSWRVTTTPGGNHTGWYPWATLAIVAGILSLFARPVRFGLSVGVFFLVVALLERRSEGLVFEDRGFFGFVRVRLDTGSDDNKYLALIHGGINHGWQALDPAHRRDPITYFHPTGGIGQVFAKFSWPDARLPASLVGLGNNPWAALVDTQSEPAYAVVGLGIGTLASHAKPYQHMRFYEIDPIIKRLSVPPKGQEPVFHYVRDAEDRGAKIDIIMGDGRLRLQEAPEHYYHILVLDAFSSDAIPVHLLTKEALQLYLTTLAEGGVLIFNTTNRYVDITGILADLAHDLDLDCWYYGDYGISSMPTKFGSDWVVMQRRNLGTRSKAYNGGPPMARRVVIHADQAKEQGTIPWKAPEGLGGPVWTDRYSNLLAVLRWR